MKQSVRISNRKLGICTTFVLNLFCGNLSSICIYCSPLCLIAFINMFYCSIKRPTQNNQMTRWTQHNNDWVLPPSIVHNFAAIHQLSGTKPVDMGWKIASRSHNWSVSIIWPSARISSAHSSKLQV